MRLCEIVLGTKNLEDSVNFYTEALGLKEIERRADDKGQTFGVVLQGKDINSCLVLVANVDENFSHISFTVDNLDTLVQKLETEGVDVDLQNEDNGTQTAYFSDPKNENIRVCLTTDDPPDMSGGEETEIRINRIILKAIVGLTLPFYTQILGLKEIEGWTYEDNQKDVGLQAGEIYIELQEAGWFKSGDFDSICFEVDNLYNTIQKLEAAGVDVDLEDADEHGRRWAFFKGPDNVNIVLGGLDQAMSDEETDSQDGNTERPSIGEKVRFWEEQDKINQALIPRVMEMHEVVTDLHKRTSNISSQIAAAEARVLQQVREEISSQIAAAEARPCFNRYERKSAARLPQQRPECFNRYERKSAARLPQQRPECFNRYERKSAARLIKN